MFGAAPRTIAVARQFRQEGAAFSGGGRGLWSTGPGGRGAGRRQIHPRPIVHVGGRMIRVRLGRDGPWAAVTDTVPHNGGRTPRNKKSVFFLGGLEPGPPDSSITLRTCPGHGRFAFPFSISLHPLSRLRGRVPKRARQRGRGRVGEISFPLGKTPFWRKRQPHTRPPPHAGEGGTFPLRLHSHLVSFHLISPGFRDR